jgi:hypothetical protein
LAASDEKLSHDLNAPERRENERKREKESVTQIRKKILAAHCADKEIISEKMLNLNYSFFHAD